MSLTWLLFCEDVCHLYNNKTNAMFPNIIKRACTKEITKSLKQSLVAPHLMALYLQYFTFNLRYYIFLES